jgi:diguanylate cyclase (GGDEF)-like protein
MEDISEPRRLLTLQGLRSRQTRSPDTGMDCTACVALSINDLGSVRATLGHLIGEQVLALCAERILGEIRDGDQVLDLGGDVFAVLLHGLADKTVVQAVAERLIERLQRSLLIEGHLVDIAVSAGIAMNQGSTDDLIKKSSIALHAVTVYSEPRFFVPELEDRLRLRQSLVRDLRRALPLRQFALHYQPQVDLVRGRISGVEALVRWKHPTLGLVSPGEFIPIAESTGVICDLGARILRTACRQASTLDPEIVMAVNVSPVQFRSPQFLTDVRNALVLSRLPGSRLEIEITEGVLLNSSDLVTRTMESLRGLGVRLAMDDFGTGYSSLSQLAQFQFDTIKIDRSLVGRDPKHRAIVRSIVALSRGLGMNALAEGIETDQDLLALREDGCEYFQGYLFGKPSPAANLESVLQGVTQKLTEPATTTGHRSGVVEPIVTRSIRRSVRPTCRQRRGSLGLDRQRDCTSTAP